MSTYDTTDAIIDEIGVDANELQTVCDDAARREKEVDRREQAIAEADPDDALGVRGATSALLDCYDPTTKSLRDIEITAAELVTMCAVDGTELGPVEAMALAEEVHAEEAVTLRGLKERAASIRERERLVVDERLSVAEAMIRLKDDGWASPDAVLPPGEATWQAQRAIIMSQRAREAVAHLPPPPPPKAWWR